MAAGPVFTEELPVTDSLARWLARTSRWVRIVERVLLLSSLGFVAVLLLALVFWGPLGGLATLGLARIMHRPAD